MEPSDKVFHAISNPSGGPLGLSASYCLAYLFAPADFTDEIFITAQVAFSQASIDLVSDETSYGSPQQAAFAGLYRSETWVSVQPRFLSTLALRKQPFVAAAAWGVQDNGIFSTTDGPQPEVLADTWYNVQTKFSPVPSKVDRAQLHCGSGWAYTSGEIADVSADVIFIGSLGPTTTILGPSYGSGIHVASEIYLSQLQVGTEEFAGDIFETNFASGDFMAEGFAGYTAMGDIGPGYGVEIIDAPSWPLYDEPCPIYIPPGGGGGIFPPHVNVHSAPYRIPLGNINSKRA